MERAEELLDRLEGAIRIENESDVCEIFKDEENIEGKVHDTLRRHLSYWEKTGASEFALSVIRNRYVPQMTGIPERYEEPNNLSYRNEK